MRMTGTIGRDGQAGLETEAEAAAWMVITNVPPATWCGAVLEAPQTIGRAVEAEIRVPAEYRSVSRRHCEVRADRRGLWIRDLSSTSGTHVNGVWLDAGREFQISGGDRIWLGGLELAVVHDLDPLQSVLSEVEDAGPHDTTLFKSQKKTAEVPPQIVLQDLTHAELEVVLWMCRGYTSLDEIGKKLFRSPHTVRTQLNSIFRKLGVHSREELMGWLRRKHADEPMSRTPAARVERVARSRESAL